MEEVVTNHPDETFRVGERLGRGLRPGDVVLLHGGLGAGKTLFTKGIVKELGYDPDEVTSPSFALVNLYKTGRSNIYHIDLWRIDESGDAAFAVGLPEILEDPSAIVIIEWAERLSGMRSLSDPIVVEIRGDGDEPRRITISRSGRNAANAV